MGIRSGQYSKNIYSAFNRVWGPLLQKSRVGFPIPVVDADWNDGYESTIENIKRFRYEVFGDGTPGSDHWQITPSAISATNNFEIEGGDSSVEGAARMYVGGLMAVKPGVAGANDLQYDPDHLVTAGFVAADAADYIYRPSTAMSESALVDVDANWIPGELIGRWLIPNVASADVGAAVRFQITNNTPTTITVDPLTGTGGGGVGMLTDAPGANAKDYYCVDISTPIAFPAEEDPRIDEVYLDVYLDEWDATEDTDLLHTVIDGPPGGIECCRRLKVSQQIQIYQNSTGGLGAYPLEYVSVAGNQHYRILLATISRATADTDIDLADVTDERPYTPGYGSSQEVIDARDSTVYSTVYTSLDDRLEFVEDDAFDAQQHMHEAREDGTISGGVCTIAAGPGTIDYTAWVGYVHGERVSIAGANYDIFTDVGAGTWIMYVDSVGVIGAAAVAPVNTAPLCRAIVAGGPVVSAIWDWRWFIDVLDNKLDIVVEESVGGLRGNMNDLQAAIDYAILNGYGTIRVKGDNTAYATTQAITITTVDGVNPTNLRIVFDSSAQIQPNAAAFNAFEISNATNLTIEGLYIDGTNMGVLDIGIEVAGCSQVFIRGHKSDGTGIGLSIGTVDTLIVEDVIINNAQTYCVAEAAANSHVHIRNGFMDSANAGIIVGAGFANTNFVVESIQFGPSFTTYGIYLGGSADDCTVKDCDFGGINGLGLAYLGGERNRFEKCYVAASTCVAGGIITANTAINSIINECNIVAITGAPCISVAGHRTNILNTTIDETGIAQYAIQLSNADNTIVSNCSILGSSNDGIHALLSDYFIIENTYITSCNDANIHIEECNQSKIIGCSLVDNVIPGSAINLVGNANVVVAGNIITQINAGLSYGISMVSTGGGTPNTYCNISNNIIDLLDSQVGILIGGTNLELYHIIESNIIYFAAGATSHGIWLANLNDCKIVDNVISTARYGINASPAVVDLDRCTISGNSIITCGRGIWFDRPSEDTIIDRNIIYDPQVEEGIFLDATGNSHIVVSKNIVFGCAAGQDGILIATATRKIITGNISRGNGLNGISLSAVTYSNVNNNICSSNTTNGISVLAGSNNIINNNSCLVNTQNGIKVDTSDFNVINGNNCTFNVFSGIHVDADYNAVVGNICNNNTAMGIYVLVGADYCTINGNICYINGWDGINYHGDWGSIVGNSCHVNIGVGVFLGAAAHDNSVVGNTAQGNTGAFDIDNSSNLNNGLGVTGAAANITTNVCALTNTAPAGQIRN